MTKALRQLAFIQILLKNKHYQQKILEVMTSKLYNAGFINSISSGLSEGGNQHYFFLIILLFPILWITFSDCASSLPSFPSFLSSFVYWHVNLFIFLFFVLIMSTFLVCLQILGFVFIFKNKVVERSTGALVYINGYCHLVRITMEAVGKLSNFKWMKLDISELELQCPQLLSQFNR